MGYKLLIIDDDKIVGHIVKEGVSEIFDEISVIREPLKAMAEIEMFQPDIILLDVVMPDLTGLELLEIIRKKYSSLQLPVIMMTSLTSEKKIVNALELGANDYLTKPFNMVVGQARLSVQLNVLEIAKQQQQLEKLSAVKAMIATYNHEINNPLAIAIGYLDRDFVKFKESHFNSVRKSFDRIAAIVKQIDRLADGATIGVKDYVRDVAMIDLDNN